jgi:hypothetical protein
MYAHHIGYDRCWVHGIEPVQATEDKNRSYHETQTDTGGIETEKDSDI